MPDVPYTHGHHDAVLRSHRWRTAENSASYLLGRLRPGLDLLDVGCGPGTVTADLARRVAPGGSVVGVDAAEAVVAEARRMGEGVPGLSFEVADLFALPYEDDRFDVVHAHQVLQHVGDPVAALREMRRVCRPGGVVAARDADYPRMTYVPEDPDLARAFAAYGAVTRANGAHWDAAPRLYGWALEAGFAEVATSASAWCFATPREREWWGGLWAERFTSSALADRISELGIADDDGLADFAAGWRRWAATDGAWFGVLHGEILATA
jgi:ubiquinone/menaquinone biosynthesis C-methylase UbiE